MAKISKFYVDRQTNTQPHTKIFLLPKQKGKSDGNLKYLKFQNLFTSYEIFNFYHVKYD